MKKRKRVPKVGFVYLLQSTCGKYAKYGATTQTKQRIRNINYTNPFGVKFQIVREFPTDDIYALENKIKWYFVDQQICMSEYFILSETSVCFDLITSLWEGICQKVG